MNITINPKTSVVIEYRITEAELNRILCEYLQIQESQFTLNVRMGYYGGPVVTLRSIKEQPINNPEAKA